MNKARLGSNFSVPIPLFKSRKFLSPFALAVVLAAAGLTDASALEVKVFLLGGQSNSVGQAAATGLPTSPVNLQDPQADVLFYYGGTRYIAENLALITLRPGSGGNRNSTDSRFGPEITFGRTIADSSPSVAYAIIKHGENGTALYNDWAPTTGASYTNFKATVDAGLAALQSAGHTTEIVGMLWQQGESDGIEGQQANYQSNLTEFIADVRSRYGANLPFLIGEIRRTGAAAITVVDAQIAVATADSFAKFVPADDLTFRDGLHFDAPGQIALGERFAAAYAELMNNLGSDTTPPIISNFSPANGDDNFPVASDLVVTFNKNIVIGSGNITIKNLDTATQTVIPVGDAQVSISGAVLTINPTVDLAMGTNYAIQMEAGAITDQSANPFGGIVDDTTWNFTTSTVITGVSINDFSSELSSRLAVNLINGSGFDEVNGFHSNNRNLGNDPETGTMWTSVGTALGSKDDPLPAHVTFDLGANYDLNKVKIWNWNDAGSLSAGSKDVEISVASTVGGSFTSVTSVVLAVAPGTTNVDFGQVVDLSGFSTVDNVRLVRFDITSNIGDVSHQIVGLSEVRFDGSPVPINGTFASWIANPVFDLDPVDQDFVDDSDNDGISNVLEAWFGTHPGQFNVGLADLATDGIITTFKHPRNETSPSDLSGLYEWSPNLNDWYASDSGPSGGPTVNLLPNTVGTTTSVSATSSEALDALFLRVGVTQN